MTVAGALGAVGAVIIGAVGAVIINSWCQIKKYEWPATQLGSEPRGSLGLLVAMLVTHAEAQSRPPTIYPDIVPRRCHDGATLVINSPPLRLTSLSAEGLLSPLYVCIRVQFRDYWNL
jgi:hypothetical protein